MATNKPASFHLSRRRSPSIRSCAEDDAKEQALFLGSKSDAVVTRSLRRRLWQAFMTEDQVAAIRCYTATRSDWEQWMIQERREEKERQVLRQNKGSKLRDMLHRTPALAKSKSVGHAASVAIASSSLVSKLEGVADGGLLQLNMNPTDPFVEDDYKHPNDSYEYDVDAESKRSKEKQRRGSHAKRTHGSGTARQAFSILGLGGKRSAVAARELAASVVSQDSKDEAMDTALTTPLHEAARLGNAELVRCMLAHPQADCDARNGQGRSVLHCAAGGLTGLEAEFMNVDHIPEVGIRAPQPPTPDENEADDGAKKPAASVMKAARAVGRLFRMHGDGESKTESTAQCRKTNGDGHGHDQLDLERMDVVTVILSWTRPAASMGSECVDSIPSFDPSVHAGVSINAVDLALGRTALHYAAELGRSTLCQAILQAFYGTMLTVIDCTGRTPCELAGAGGYAQLAAYLEARALLFVDPYGTDEDLLAAIVENESALGGCVPPFGWFDTMSVADVQLRRERRITQAMAKMQQIAKKLRIRQHAKKTIYEHTQRKTPTAAELILTKVTTTVTSPTDIEGTAAHDDDDTDIFFDVPSFELAAPGEAKVASLTNSNDIGLPDDRNFSVFEQLMHKGHVELFLAFHRWDVEKALVAFYDDPFAAFQAAGVPLPQQEKRPDDSGKEKQTCLICCDEFDADSKGWKQLTGCVHSFCANCLGDYLVECSKSSTGFVVSCPHQECKSLLSPSELLELAPTVAVYDKLRISANDNFVVSADDFRFCPHPGCGQKGAVKINLPEYSKTSKLAGSGLLELVGAACTNVHDEGSDDGRGNETLDEQSYDAAVITYDGIRDARYNDLTNLVQPKRAHRFCFQCGEQHIHWPVTCERLSEWKNTIAEQIEEANGDDVVVDTGVGYNFNDVAQKLWMKANTRPCPKCKAPIQKSEGCNHMTCSNPHCKHEFCWICRNKWKLHNSESGGFFRCNRWVEQKEHESYNDEPPDDVDAAMALLPETGGDPRLMQITYGTAMHESRVAKKRSKDMARFLHHYARWNAHAESAALERNMGETVCTRLAPVVREAIAFNGDEHVFGGKGLSFIHAAFLELLECRSMLRHSYAFSFFRYKSTSIDKYKLLKRHISEKLAFEQFQSELELMTEQISDVVARLHIRATQTQITFLTAAAAEKRKEFSNVMINILLEEKKEANRVKKRDDRDVRRLFGGGLDTIIGLAAGRPSSGAAVGESLSRSESEESDAAAEAVRESLDEFLANTGSGSLFEYNSSDEEISDWACSACTYVNSEGRRCDMCGTRKE